MAPWREVQTHSLAATHTPPPLLAYALTCGDGRTFVLVGAQPPSLAEMHSPPLVAVHCPPWCDWGVAIACERGRPGVCMGAPRRTRSHLPHTAAMSTASLAAQPPPRSCVHTRSVCRWHPPALERGRGAGVQGGAAPPPPMLPLQPLLRAVGARHILVSGDHPPVCGRKTENTPGRSVVGWGGGRSEHVYRLGKKQLMIFDYYGHSSAHVSRCLPAISRQSELNPINPIQSPYKFVVSLELLLSVNLSKAAPACESQPTPDAFHPGPPSPSHLA